MRALAGLILVLIALGFVVMSLMMAPFAEGADTSNHAYWVPLIIAGVIAALAWLIGGRDEQRE